MTVFNPSLPPDNCTTTRMLSLLTPGFFASAANAIFDTNAGTVPPRLITPNPPRPTRSISRLETFMVAPEDPHPNPFPAYRARGGRKVTFHSRQLKLRHRH